RNINDTPEKDDKDFKQASSELYKWMFKQPNNSIETELKNNNIKTLVFVLGSYSTALRNIPIAALYDEENNQYLIQKGYGIALNLGSELIKTKALNKSKLNILAAGVSEENPVPEVDPEAFPELPSVVDELCDIKDDEKFKSKKILPNDKFTPKALKNSINSKAFGVIHLATHGQFSSSPDDTFILAYKKHINVNQLGNLLRSRQEKRTEPIELLVLSACETANGDKRASLGIAGVSVKVGARSIVASLFRVKDSPTYELMKTFYEKLDETGVTRAEALRYAQNELLKKGNSVYYWAPFVLVGNWS
ncbi:MAG: CHAT domain-containing protein, partial [Cyanobacteria bacterium P01_H01_bin.150]